MVFTFDDCCSQYKTPLNQNKKQKLITVFLFFNVLSFSKPTIIWCGKNPITSPELLPCTKPFNQSLPPIAVIAAEEYKILFNSQRKSLAGNINVGVLLQLSSSNPKIAVDQCVNHTPSVVGTFFKDVICTEVFVKSQNLQWRSIEAVASHLQPSEVWYKCKAKKSVSKCFFFFLFYDNNTNLLCNVNVVEIFWMVLKYHSFLIKVNLCLNQINLLNHLNIQLLYSDDYVPKNVNLCIGIFFFVTITNLGPWKFGWNIGGFGNFLFCFCLYLQFQYWLWFK